MLYALLFLALLQLGDWFTTRRVFAAGGHELNPLMGWLQQKIGFTAAMLVKGLGVVAIGYWTALLLGILGPILLCVFYAGIVAWNWKQVR